MDSMKRLAVAAMPVVMSLISACVAPIALTRGAKVPAASGTLVAKRSDDGNTSIDLSVRHLAKPGQVDSKANFYVVWVQDIDRKTPPQSVGVLPLNDNLEGHLLTVSALSGFDLTITPEPSHQAAVPTTEPVFSAHVPSP